MATLNLVKAEGKSGTEYFLQGTGDPSKNADFSLFDWDGEGGDPFQFGARNWEIVEGIDGVDYDSDDTDSFWSAQVQIVRQAEAAGIEVPAYAKGE